MHELISPAFNFIVLVAVLGYFLRKPVKEMVASRHTAIKTQVDEAKALKLDADKRFKEFDQRLASFEKEAKEILERARRDAETTRDKIIASARNSAERIIKEAEITAAANVQETKDQVRKEIIAKAVDMAERMIQDRLNSEDQKRIINEYVGKVRTQ